MTWKSNLMGTINILESLKEIKKNTKVVLITSDKVYKNIETRKGYKENDLLVALILTELQNLLPKLQLNLI